MSGKLAVLLITTATVASVIQGQLSEVDGECHSQERLNSSFETRAQFDDSSLYIHPDSISCNGTLTSWIVCGHFNNSSNITAYVYRRYKSTNKFVNSTKILISPQNHCTSFNVSETQRFSVLTGDRIVVTCEAANQCPLFISENSRVFVTGEIEFSICKTLDNVILAMTVGIDEVPMVPDSASKLRTVAISVVVGLAGTISLIVVVIVVCAIVTRRKKSGTDSDGTAVPEQIPLRRNRVLTNSNAYCQPYEIPVPQESQLGIGEDTPNYEMDDGNFWEPASEEHELTLQLSHLRVPLINDQDLQVSEYLGSGQFGTVNKGVWHTPSKELEVAVKSLTDGSSEDERVKFLQEATITGQFKHPNIVRLYAIVTLPQLRIVLELLPKGDLRHYLKSLRPPPGSEVPPELPAILLSFCRQVAAGMSHLSSKGFIHRDLAARNILISQNGVCKIADFGLSRDLQYESFYTSHGGKIPVKWTAPEAISYRQYSTASDVWSYGVLLYEIWSLGGKPYKDFTNQEVVQRVSSGFRLAPPPGCPRPIYEIMISCWNPSVDHRPSFPDILVTIQQPDFKLLQLSSEHSPTVDERTRTLGKPVETAEELYKDLQHTYIASCD